MKKEFRLPREFAEKWLAALRSGDYNQGQGALYEEKTNGYCCVGVAARIEYPLHYLKNKSGTYGGIIFKGAQQNDDHLRFNLHKIPIELHGTSNNNALVAKLVKLNDNQEYSFKQIANWIEKNVKFYDKV